MMDKNDLKIIERFRAFVSQKVKIHELRVFGSRARGDATWESDLDILVIVDHLDHAIEREISDCAWEAGFEDGIVIVPIVFSRDIWENSPQRYSLLVQAIKKEGIFPKELSKSFHKTFELRQVSDYKNIESVSMGDSQEALQKAVIFISDS